jgi:Ca2+-transporting ATPase
MQVLILHDALKGRARYQVRGLYRSELLKRRLEGLLRREVGVQRVSASVLTGHLLVLFNSDRTAPAIATIIEQIVLDGSEPLPYPPSSPNGHHPATAHSSSLPPVRRPASAPVGPGRKEGTEWHLHSSTAVLSELDVSLHTGLTAEIAGERLKRHGANILPGSVPRSGLSIFFGQFKSLPVALLGVAAGLSVVTAGAADAVIILGVIVINATIGYLTESQAERTLQSLKSLVRPMTLTLRDTHPTLIKAEEVAIGDVLVLKPGTYIAADARLVATDHLHVDESALTGESMPVKKSAEALLAEEIPLADRINMAYMGTLVTGGSGFAVVVATGANTEMGRIQTLVGEAEAPQTPMERQLDQMGTQLVIISGAVCGLVFVIGLLRGYGVLQMLTTSVSLAVAAVPEGLPTIATTTLALGIRNMRRHHVLIRHLNAVETLGSVQTICMDKTGTITLNRMTVVEIHVGMKRLQTVDGAFSDGVELVNPFTCDELLRLLHVGVLCSETEIALEHGEYRLQGSPTENALIHAAIGADVDVLKLRERYPLLKMQHRSENRNYMATLHAVPDPAASDPPYLLAVKGSPTEVLAMCRAQVKAGEVVPLTEDDRLAIQVENEQLSGRALRVLGLAYTQLDGAGTDEEAPNRLIWLGLIGMADPVRHGVKELIGAFHQAGINTVMITGDQTPTAYAIGKELGLSGRDELEILDSTHLTQLEPEVMTALAERVHIFARVSPAHKLQIVQALQRKGRVVAMTGDGINDGPALKAADIGIAMGHTGTDVAREVADIVLEDDRLETMIIAVSHGRTIYRNIRKSVHFLLATNVSEIMVMLVAIGGGLGQPLNPMQLLWINLVSDIFPGLALALEPPEPDILSRPPRNPGEPIVQPRDFRRIGFEAAALSAGALGAYGYGIARYGMGPRAGTLAFMSLTTGQLLHALSCRSEERSLFRHAGPAGHPLPPNRYLQAALGVSLGLQALAVIVPGLRSLLGITPLSLLDGAVIGGSALLPLAVNELTKPTTSVPAATAPLTSPERTSAAATLQPQEQS